jgi:endoglycosylceramidase
MADRRWHMVGTISHIYRPAHGPLSVIAVLGLALSLAGCGNSEDSVAVAATATPTATAAPILSPSEFLPVRVEGTAFRDAMGRQVLLRGYNARVEGIFDVTFDDGRIALEDIPPFNDDDARRFEELGLNVLRLPVDWSGLEPHPLQYSEPYMQTVDAVVELGRQHHFYVLIDMHQDAYSKEIGEDGAPLWAIEPPPQMLLQGPLTDLDSRRASQQVLLAFGKFFNNQPAADGRPLQDAFVAAVQQLVRRYTGNPAVVGYEAFNEPIANDAQLDAFHARLAAGVHAIDPQAAVFFEPNSFRNQTDSARIPTTPWANGPGVYAPHIYTTVFSPPGDSWASEDPSVLTASVENAAHEAAAWGTPLFVGEYGIDQSIARGHLWLAAELDLQDQFLASSTIWVWRETGTWGLKAADDSERTLTVQTVSRPNPRAVAGDLVAIERPAAGHLVVHYRATDATANLPHEVSVSPAYLTRYEIRCDGMPVAVSAVSGRAQFTCPAGADGSEHNFEVVGATAF